jgi:hypothetical protein
LLRVERVTKAIQTILLSLVLSVSVLAEVGTTVYLSEPNMVLEPISDINGVVEYPEIMVGTKLAIVVDSNEEDKWTMGLFVEPPYMGLGTLEGRGYVDDPNYVFPGDYRGSHYPAAGPYALVFDWSVPTREGFILDTDFGPDTGEWFGLDYTASEVGLCRVRLKYWYPPTGTCTPPWCDPHSQIPEPPEERLIEELVFRQVPSRDFDGDGVVGFTDYAILAGCWNELVSDPNGPCGVDLNGDALVDFTDFGLFADFWLERTEY